MSQPRNAEIRVVSRKTMAPQTREPLEREDCQEAGKIKVPSLNCLCCRIFEHLDSAREN